MYVNKYTTTTTTLRVPFDYADYESVLDPILDGVRDTPIMDGWGGG